MRVHIWGKGLPTNPAHRQISSFSQDDLLQEMDAAGVDAAVIHPPGWDPDSNALAVEAARQHPNRLSVLGNFPWIARRAALCSTAGSNDQGCSVCDSRSCSRISGPGRRMAPSTGCGPRLNAPGSVALAAANFLPVVGQVAERHAGLRLIIDHFGRPSGTKDEAAWANLPELLALAKYPNVAVKATGAPSYSSAPYPYRNIHTYIRQLYDAFGPERLFWGTDITRMPCSWRQCVTMFTEELPWLSASDKDLIMGRALCTWLDWQLPG